MSERKLPPRKCYFAAEVAAMLGYSVDEFYVHRAALEKAGMPRSVTARIRIPKIAFDAWLNRDHPTAPQRRPDNDPVPLPEPQSDTEHREYLRRIYNQRQA